MCFIVTVFLVESIGLESLDYLQSQTFPDRLVIIQTCFSVLYQDSPLLREMYSFLSALLSVLVVFLQKKKQLRPDKHWQNIYNGGWENGSANCFLG